MQEYERLIGKARDRMLEAEGNSEKLTAGEKLELGQLYALCALAEKVEEIANAMTASRNCHTRLERLRVTRGWDSGMNASGTAADNAKPGPATCAVATVIRFPS